jgi:release factor glutamine methyltransferase
MNFADAVARLRKAGVDNPRLDARLLGELATGEAAFDSLVARREKREPVAYIAGKKEFWSLEFSVGPGVLIPRPETETLIEAVLKAFPDRARRFAILDLGCGSGCILAALLAEYSRAEGIGVEASPLAAEYAERNLKRLGLSGRGRIVRSNWADFREGCFDIAVSNPPYVKSGDIAALAPEISEYEPPQALDGGPDGLAAYRQLTPKIYRILKSGGGVFVEVGAGEDEAVKHIFISAGFAETHALADLGGTLRVVAARKP